MLCLQQGVEMLSRQIRVTRLLLKKTQDMSHLNQNHQNLLRRSSGRGTQKQEIFSRYLENISCEELQKYVLISRMFPGELDPNYPNPNEENLNVSEIMTADFFEEYHRITMGDYVIGTDLIRGTFAEPYVDEGTDETDENTEMVQ